MPRIEQGPDRPRRVAEIAALPALVLGGIALRVAPSFHQCFTFAYVSFQDDGWYHMRRVDNLVASFPAGIAADPYAAPGGQHVAIAPLLDLLIAACIRLLVGPVPATRAADAVAAVVPAVLGALVAVPAFLLARDLYGRAAGYVAAGLAALGPGPFLQRSLVGYTDHHVLEVLTSALVLTALVVAVRGRSSRMLPGLLAGAALAAHLLAWTSGAFLVFVLAGWVPVQALLERARGRAGPGLAIVAGPCFSAALLLVVAFQDPRMPRYALQVGSLLAGLGAVLVTEAAIRVSSKARLGWRAVLLVLLALAALLVVAVGGWWPELVRLTRADLSRLLPSASARTVSEITPLLELGRGPRVLRPLELFSTPFYLGLPALAMLSWRSLRTADAAASLLSLWSLAALVATLGQNRFGYYLALALAVLTGGCCQAAGARIALIAARRPRAIRVALLGGLGATLLAPALLLAYRQAQSHLSMPQGWHSSLRWLRENSPEPFGDPGFYTRHYSMEEATRRPAYTVMAWWDYGYWVIRVGRRVPVANPTQSGADVASRYLLETRPSAADALLARAGSRYVMVDDLLLFQRLGADELLGKFATLAEWAGERPPRFYAGFEERGPDGSWRTVPLFFPDYFRTMAVRLYLYRGQAVEPAASSWVVSFREGARREILAARLFETYAEAQAYRDSLGPGNHLIASRDPLRTCVPLEAVAGLRVVHEPTDGDIRSIGMPSVRVFERLPGRDVAGRTSS